MTHWQYWANKALNNLTDEIEEDNPVSDDSADIKDDKELTSKEREQRFIKLFKQHGIQLEFVGTTL